MSSEYMRQILESIDMAQNINEGYDDRVNDVVSIIRRNYPDGITKKEFPAAVERAGQESGAVEMRGKTQAGLNQKGIGDSRKDFIKDVAAKIDFKRDTSTATAKKERREQVLNQLGNIIGDAVGMSFPDGDPFDHIYPKARKLGVPADDVLKWLDIAAKRAGLGKSYYDYLQSLWDDQYADAKSDYERSGGKDGYAKDRYDMLGGDNYRNPWGSGY